MGNSFQTVSALVVAARAGDVAAYGKLVRSTQAMALAVALNVLREPAAAEDAVQEAYLRTYRSLRGCASLTPRTWKRFISSKRFGSTNAKNWIRGN